MVSQSIHVFCYQPFTSDIIIISAFFGLQENIQIMSGQHISMHEDQSALGQGEE